MAGGMNNLDADNRIESSCQFYKYTHERTYYNCWLSTIERGVQHIQPPKTTKLGLSGSRYQD